MVQHVYSELPKYRNPFPVGLCNFVFGFPIVHHWIWFHYTICHVVSRVIIKYIDRPRAVRQTVQAILVPRQRWTLRRGATG